MTKLRINLGSAATVYYTASHAQYKTVTRISSLHVHSSRLDCKMSTLTIWFMRQRLITGPSKVNDVDNR